MKKVAGDGHTIFYKEHLSKMCYLKSEPSVLIEKASNIRDNGS